MTQQINPATPVYVQQTCTGAELTSAAVIGFFTAGPLGIWASRKALKEFQGKWGAWFCTGLIGAPLCLFIQFMALGAVGYVVGPSDDSNDNNSALLQPSHQSAPTAPTVEPVVIPAAALAAPTPEPQIAMAAVAPSPSLAGLFANDPFIETGMK